MKKLLSVKDDGSLNISTDDKLYCSFRKPHIFFTSKSFASIMLVFLVFIDIGGFRQITNLTMTESVANQIIIISALAIAFEIAPVYIGYAICLKKYSLGERIQKIIFGLSSTACVLGIVSNTVFRILTMKIAYYDYSTESMDEIALPMTILMCILPLITSLINLVIGCLSFDPLLFDIARLSKKLRMLKVNKRQIDSCINNANNDDELKKIYLDNLEQRYTNAIKDIDAISLRLKSYVKIRAKK